MPNAMTIFRWRPPNGGVECRWGRYKSRFWTNSWLSIDDCCSARSIIRSSVQQCITVTVHICLRHRSPRISEYAEEIICTDRHEASRGLSATCSSLLAVKGQAPLGINCSNDLFLICAWSVQAHQAISDCCSLTLVSERRQFRSVQRTL